MVYMWYSLAKDRLIQDGLRYIHDGLKVFQKSLCSGCASKSKSSTE